MHPLFTTLIDGLRAAFLRPPRGTALTRGAGVFIALIAIYFVVELGINMFDSGIGPLDPAGVSTVLADSLLTLVAAWLLTRFAGRRDIVWGSASILLAATVVIAVAIHWPLDHLASALLAHDNALLAAWVGLLSNLWWFLVLFAFAHWLAPRGLGRTLVAALLAYALSAAAWWWLPAAPLLLQEPTSSLADVSGNGQIIPPGNTNSAVGEPPDNAEASPPTFDPEAVMFNQSAVLDAELAKLRPQTPGKVDLYVVTFAGDAEENVFRNEAEYAERLFAQRFDADGRVLVLENNAATTATRPLATWTNLHYALNAIAKKMDPAEDILLVYLTTHGSEDHQLLVDLDPLPLDQIQPEDLADALKTTPGIRWKVIVVNACYSGGFVDALRDDSTMVITSARADRTSFGCGADSDLTYFGKAFLVDALNQTTSLRHAFDLAKQSVATWENADKEEHSEPQIATSPSIEAKLATWQQQLPAHAPVPFAPATPAAGGDE
ncbi:MAG: C13 family peptidase [Dokdonella sp.]